MTPTEIELRLLDIKRDQNMLDKRQERLDQLHAKYEPRDYDPFLLATYKLVMYWLAIRKMKRDFPLSKDKTQ